MIHSETFNYFVVFFELYTHQPPQNLKSKSDSSSALSTSQLQFSLIIQDQTTNNDDEQQKKQSQSPEKQSQQNSTNDSNNSQQEDSKKKDKKKNYLTITENERECASDGVMLCDGEIMLFVSLDRQHVCLYNMANFLGNTFKRKNPGDSNTKSSNDKDNAESDQNNETDHNNSSNNNNTDETDNNIDNSETSNNSDNNNISHSNTIDPPEKPKLSSSGCHCLGLDLHFDIEVGMTVHRVFATSLCDGKVVLYYNKDRNQLIYSGPAQNYKVESDSSTRKIQFKNPDERVVDVSVIVVISVGFCLTKPILVRCIGIRHQQDMLLVF